MTENNEQEYRDLLKRTLERIVEKTKQRDALDSEIAKSEEFYRVTANMLEDEERNKFMAMLAEAKESRNIKDAGLTAAIRKIIGASGAKFLTVAEVRDRLVNSGFDFSQYVSNPMASISTTLKRFKAEEVEAAEIKGVTAYRMKPKAIPMPISSAPPPSATTRLRGR